MLLEKLAIIGNCQYSALIDVYGAVRWCCLPRFDSEPVFGSLLDSEAGRFQVSTSPSIEGVHAYLDNTNILTTTFTTKEGSFRVIDFAPRFEQYDRMFRPTQLVRIIEPLEGTPLVSVHCAPILGWSKSSPLITRGSNHLNFDGYDSLLRLTTDIPVTYLDGTPFVLSTKKYMVLSMGAPVEESLPDMCERFFTQTEKYWRRWVKQCTVPPDYQSDVIRSALVLKLHCFEDTGAIVAAMTTSIPEAPGSGRCWDYRYCWLRDAYYVLGAFRLLGLFEERENFTNFLLGIVAGSDDLTLYPLYKVDGKRDLKEHIVSGWEGYLQEQPVRIGNDAATQQQNDIYGEMVLCLAPIFLDDRFSSERTKSTYDLLYKLAKKSIELAGTPDAGIWEYRTTKETAQTFSSLMSWAAADRLAIISKQLGFPNQDLFKSSAKIIQDQIIANSWDDSISGFVSHYGGTSLDAALLQMPYLRFLGKDDRILKTIRVIQKKLSHNGFLMRYDHDDGFGYPEVAFLICSFWLVEALSILGEREEAASLMQTLMAKMPKSGLFSEDMDYKSGTLWGNFPQAYSHVGLIHAAFAASKRWSEIL